MSSEWRPTPEMLKRLKTYRPHRSGRFWQMIPEGLPGLEISGPYHLRAKPIQIVGGKTWSLTLMLGMKDVTKGDA